MLGPAECSGGERGGKYTVESGSSFVSLGLVFFEGGDVVGVRIRKASDGEIDFLAGSDHARGNNVVLEGFAESSTSHGSEFRWGNGDEEVADTVELQKRSGGRKCKVNLNWKS